MKVSELKDELLDCWVAKAEGWKAYKEKRGGDELCVTQFPDEREPWTRYSDHEQMKAKYTEIPLIEAVKIGFYGTGVYKFSTDWAHGGPIIEREKINVGFDKDCGESAVATDGVEIFYGKTYLQAAMRSFVASKYGEEVPE